MYSPGLLRSRPGRRSMIACGDIQTVRVASMLPRYFTLGALSIEVAYATAKLGVVKPHHNRAINAGSMCSFA